MADEQGYFEVRIEFISPSFFPDLAINSNTFTDAVIPSESVEQIWGQEVSNHRFVLACKSTNSLTFSKTSLMLNVCGFPRLAEDTKRICNKLDPLVSTKDTENDILMFVAENLRQTLEGFKLSRRSAINPKLTVFVRKFTPFPLSKIVFEAESEESYQWASKQLKKFVAENTSKSYGVLRERELLSACVCSDGRPALLHIVHSEPFVQGIITPETCVIITKMFRDCEAEIINPNDVEETAHVLEIPAAESLLISDFTNNLAELSIDHQGSNFLMDSVIDLNAHYSPKCLELGVCLQMQPETHQQCKGFVSLETLSALKLFHGTWIKVCVQQAASTKQFSEGGLQCIIDSVDEEKLKSFGSDMKMQDQQNGYSKVETEEKQFHVVQLFCIENTTLNSSSFCEFSPMTCHSGKLNNHILYVSPLLYYNLTGCCYQDTNKETVDIFVQPMSEDSHNDQETLSHSLSQTSVYEPPFVNEAHISLIASPDVTGSDLFNTHLMDYFSIPRLLTVGDVFFVKHDWQISADDNNVAEEPKPRKMLVYFKVTKLVYKKSERAFGFVDTEHSTLYQKGVLNSYVPVLLSCLDPSSARVLEHNYGSSFWNTCNLPGLHVQVDSVEKLVKPFLRCRKNRLHPSGILVSGPLRCGKTSVVMACSRRLNLQVVECNCYDLCGDSVAATEARIRNLFQKASSCSPCILLLRNIHAMGKDREGTEDEPRLAVTLQDSISSLASCSNWPVVTIATSSSPNDISPDMFSCFLHEIIMDAPSEEERYGMLMGLTSMVNLGNDVSIKQVARKTAGFVLGDFVTFLSYAARAATEKTLEYCKKEGILQKYIELTVEFDTKGAVRGFDLRDPQPSVEFEKITHSSTGFKAVNSEGYHSSLPYSKLEADICSSGVKIHNCDIESALESLQASHADTLGAPRIPSVRWEDVGGLVDVKADILDTIQLPLQHPELFASGLRRSGVLLYGPPGTGKTLLAKAVATECSLNFLSVKGPELINMYVGQSEQNVREVFARAQSASPCVIFFDELDSLAPNRGRSGDSGGVMDRIVSQLLAELDGLHKSCDVFVIGATNRPDLLDPALLRPGRFDKMLYLGVSKDHDSQLKILKALTRKFSLDPSFRLQDFSRRCPLNLTGADLYSLCSDAMLQAIKRNIAGLKQGADELQVKEIMVVEDDFLLALESLVPSVSFEELQRFEKLQQQFLLSK